MCFNKKVIAGLVVVGLAILVFAPNLIGAALPLLLIAVCPLSMLFIMKAMSGSNAGSCSTKQGTSADEELAQLRAEVQRLRVEQSRRDVSVPVQTRGLN